jgi:alpha-glucosidase
MLTLNKDNGYLLSYCGRTVIVQTDSSSFIRAGWGTAAYTLKKMGVFKYSEKLSYSESLKIISSEKVSRGYRFILRGKRDAIELLAEEDDRRLCLSFRILEGNINRCWITMPSSPKEHIYGCGECFTTLDLKGKKVRIWVAEHQNVQRLMEKYIKQKLGLLSLQKSQSFSKYDSYYVQPTFTTSEKTCVHVDTAAYCEFNFTPESTVLYIREIPKSVYVYQEDNFPTLLGSLTDDLGRQPELPAWIFEGAILAIQGGIDVINKKLSNAKSANLPVTAVWSQDWCGTRKTSFGSQVFWNWSYDNKLYPELPAWIVGLKERGIRFLSYINTFFTIDGDLYREGSAKGYMVKTKDQKDYLVTITSFPAAIIDLTNPEACEWMKGIIHRNMIDIGISGWMADFGEYLPTDCVLKNGNPEHLHNEWPALWAKLNHEAIEEAKGIGEFFFFTRAGHTKTNKYSLCMWSGDQHVDFSYDDGLASTIPSALSLAMSGYGVCHSDIGGYTTFGDKKRDSELLLRWCECNAFTPIFRSHEGNRPASNVQFDNDPETLQGYARFARIYKLLSPYYKFIDKARSSSGLPMMRPLFFHYNEPEAYTETYEYLLGSDLLVAPVIDRGALTREVYLPNDRWIHLWTKKRYTGGHHTIQAEIGNPPVFFREESLFTKLFLLISQEEQK